MTRSFDGTPSMNPGLNKICAQPCGRPPPANSAGVRLYTLGAQYVEAYFENATDEAWRERARRSEGLRRAGGMRARDDTSPGLPGSLR